MWTENFQIYKLDLEKADELEITEKAREFQKNIYFSSLTMLKPFTVWIITNCGKFWKRWEYQTTFLASGETHMQVKEQQLEPNMEQQTGSKLRKEYAKAVYCYPAYLTSMYIMWKSRLDDSQVGIKIAWRNVHNLRYADDTTLMTESEEELKNLLMNVKEESDKAGLKLSI